jgi:hypothetical protein
MDAVVAAVRQPLTMMHLEVRRPVRALERRRLPTSHAEALGGFKALSSLTGVRNNTCGRGEHQLTHYSDGSQVALMPGRDAQSHPRCSTLFRPTIVPVFHLSWPRNYHGMN